MVRQSNEKARKKTEWPNEISFRTHLTATHLMDTRLMKLRSLPQKLSIYVIINFAKRLAYIWAFRAVETCAGTVFAHMTPPRESLQLEQLLLST